MQGKIKYQLNPWSLYESRTGRIANVAWWLACQLMGRAPSLNWIEVWNWTCMRESAIIIVAVAVGLVFALGVSLVVGLVLAVCSIVVR
jgi:FtsH-binding integral membrane protein